jgi:hypothetical protein
MGGRGVVAWMGWIKQTWFGSIVIRHDRHDIDRAIENLCAPYTTHHRPINQSSPPQPTTPQRTQACIHITSIYTAYATHNNDPCTVLRWRKEKKVWSSGSMPPCLDASPSRTYAEPWGVMCVCVGVPFFVFAFIR